ncbi:tRNA (adenine(22)-N(1))-methyltransferase [Streptococcus mutans]|uniref:tRNA (adenine(22)-N(1))-methyltransferase n=1 Tax=Streptococcus mutans TaxID=1309 RepID=UPI0002B5A102|nr:tRNA (adenine(22)-N(1))-methyltransferase TrmK [Streptococcus mutans]EMC43205.1 hypothetical protein SMU98_06352 [Streptococcus mutans SM1]
MPDKKREVSLSHRLQEVASFVPKGARLLDVGSDHAYLPIYLLEQGLIDFAVAGEIIKGPYESAVTNVSESGLSGQIAVRLADGLAALNDNDDIDLITICGMGGRLIADILAAGSDKLNSVKQLILQPNNCEDDLRSWLVANDFMIKAEKMVKDRHKYYEILVVEKGKITLSDKDLRFGPFLRQERSSIFKERWRKELAKLELALTKVPAKKKADNMFLSTKIEQIKEVLYES